MVKFKQKIMNLAIGLYVHTVGSSLKQRENIAPTGQRQVDMQTSELFLRAAAEGAVLLKNDGTLPLVGKTAVFGRIQTDTFYTGYGSGGDVLKPYRVSILEGLEKNRRLTLDDQLIKIYREWTKAHPVNHGYWGNWPRSFAEMPLEEEIVKESAKRAKNAVIVIGRAAGEDRDNELKKGSFYLTDLERNMLEVVTKYFKKTALVLNVGNIMDFSFIAEYKIGAALLIWQGGMETGNAVAQLLAGDVSPCGKLSSTIAKKYENYPSAGAFGNATYNEYREDVFVGYRGLETFARGDVLYPFGFGLSYTSFDISAVYEENRISYRVKNTGKRAGKEVVQVYVRKPNGEFGNPVRELAGFHKTKLLLPNEIEEGEISLDERAFVTYDEDLSAYVMLKGKYEIYVGNDVRSSKKIFEFTIDELQVIEQLSRQCAPVSGFEVRTHHGSAWIGGGSNKKDLKKQILNALPPATEMTGDKRYKLKDVKAGKITMHEFIAQFSLEELEAISRGDYVMDSPLGASGNAGVLGGVLPSLRKKGVPPVTLADGPSGIRLKTMSSLLPITTLLACTFDEALVHDVYSVVGKEMKEREVDVLLAPAMNIQRNPLCGRNFEYFSEDPYLTGKMASAVVRGVQDVGVSACLKHFACNNQEFNRIHNDSRVSECALREIYLRGFEICVKEAKPHTIMTSYNKVNGVWAHYHFELVHGILRGEWGFDGCVITDWWMRSAASPEFPKLRRNAYRVRAGVNVLMPGGGYLGRRKSDGTLLKTYGKKEGITLGELQRNAEEILQFVMNSSALERFLKEEREKQHK